MAEPAIWSIEPHAARVADSYELHSAYELILDDGTTEADVGFSGIAALQFLWFNQFELPGTTSPLAVDGIQVLFPPGPDMAVGQPVELVVLHDPDGDPTNGADLLGTFDETIQVLDGVTFSIYSMDPPIQVPQGSGDLLVGVINRFVVSGVSPPSRPAALDTTSSAGRSWIGLWTTDPPSPPQLPTDDLLATIDFVQPGNWMIRASLTPVSAVAVPALSHAGLVTLVVLISWFAVALLRRI